MNKIPICLAAALLTMGAGLSSVSYGHPDAPNISATVVVPTYLTMVEVWNVDGEDNLLGDNTQPIRRGRGLVPAGTGDFPAMSPGFDWSDGTPVFYEPNPETDIVSMVGIIYPDYKGTHNGHGIQGPFSIPSIHLAPGITRVWAGNDKLFPESHEECANALDPTYTATAATVPGDDTTGTKAAYITRRVIGLGIGSAAINLGIEFLTAVVGWKFWQPEPKPIHTIVVRNGVDPGWDGVVPAMKIWVQDYKHVFPVIGGDCYIGPQCAGGCNPVRVYPDPVLLPPPPPPPVCGGGAYDEAWEDGGGYEELPFPFPDSGSGGGCIDGAYDEAWGKVQLGGGYEELPFPFPDSNSDDEGVIRVGDLKYLRDLIPDNILDYMRKKELHQKLLQYHISEKWPDLVSPTNLRLPDPALDPNAIPDHELHLMSAKEEWLKIDVGRDSTHPFGRNSCQLADFYDRSADGISTLQEGIEGTHAAMADLLEELEGFDIDDEHRGNLRGQLAQWAPDLVLTQTAILGTGVAMANWFLQAAAQVEGFEGETEAYLEDFAVAKELVETGEFEEAVNIYKGITTGLNTMLHPAFQVAKEGQCAAELERLSALEALEREAQAALFFTSLEEGSEGIEVVEGEEGQNESSVNDEEYSKAALK